MPTLRALLLLGTGLALLPGAAGAQGWAYTYGSFERERAASFDRRDDGSLVIGAEAGTIGASSALLLELDADGEPTAQRAYGGGGSDRIASVRATADGGVVFAGRSDSWGAGDDDAWVVKLDADGLIEWQHTYGGPGAADWAQAVVPIEGGYVVGGVTDALGPGLRDLWVFELDADGAIVWEKAYGGLDVESFGSLHPIGDGWLLAGDTYSFDVVEGGTVSNGDFWVLRLDATGGVVWERTFGLDTAAIENVELPARAIPIAGGGVAVAGTSAPLPAGNADLWLLELDGDGLLESQIRIETIGDYAVRALQQTADDGFLVSGAVGPGSAWALKLDPAFQFVWEKRYGGPDALDDEDFVSLRELPDGSHLAVGTTESYGLDAGDLWVLRLDATGDLDACPAISESSAGAALTAESGVASSATVTVTSATVGDPSATVASVDLHRDAGCEAPLLEWIGVPKSGQTATYAPRDDGALQPGVAWPTPRFVDPGDGTIHDRLTGLVWLKDANCNQTVDYPGTVGGGLPWEDALDFVAAINAGSTDISACAGYDRDDTDWRMPNANELETLVHAGHPDLRAWLELQGFVNVRDDFAYFSSTTWGFEVQYAVVMNVFYEWIRTRRKSDAYYVWPVRAGQSDAPDFAYPANVLKTGQTASYYPGDDGDVRAGVPWTRHRMLDGGDGTVTDSLTGLTWLQDATCLGQSVWAEALDRVAALNDQPLAQGCAGYDGGHDDWRMPNRKELLGLVMHDLVWDAVPQSWPFVSVESDGFYWASNTVTTNDQIAWGHGMGFSGGLQ
ncbi:MAG: DUF1566 domain-containing protein, partial [Myxococcota bacterium]|nr:DUF1566 domain-containing protein [Myxococcota bacterium]